MSYDYQTERPRLFTEDGQVEFLKVRDEANRLLKLAGAFRMSNLKVGGEMWTVMACLDRMIELGELVAWDRPSWGQFKVYTTPEVHNL